MARRVDEVVIEKVFFQVSELKDFSKEDAINRERTRRLAEWYRGNKCGPVQLDAELHKRCNLKCSFCPRSAATHDINAESKSKEMPLEKWLGVVKEAERIGNLVFNIEGANEPTYVPGLLFPVMHAVKERGMYGIITTNGTLWTDEHLKDIVDIGWDRIHFSLDSPIAADHDRLRGVPGSFDKAVRSVRSLNSFKERSGSERPMLNMNIMICNENFRRLPEMVELANRLKVDYIFVEPLMLFSASAKKLAIPADVVETEFQKYVRAAKEMADKYGIDSNFSSQDRNLQDELVKDADKREVLLGDAEAARDRVREDGTLLSAPCLKPWTQLAIKFDGTAGTCGFVQDGENVLEKDLERIWHGQLFDSVRAEMARGRLLGQCSKCVPSDITQRRRFRLEVIDAIVGAR